MSQLGLRYTSPNGLKGKLYFYITKKEFDEHNKPRYYIRVQEKTEISSSQIPIYDFLGFFNAHKGLFTLYPQKRLNDSVLDYPFIKQNINYMFVYDVSKLRTYLPLELRLVQYQEIEGTDLEAIFSEASKI